MPERREILDTVVVGGGFAGLAVSGALKAAGLSHVVFEKSRPCQTWLTQRWDSFRMNTPNVLTTMPGEAYPGPDPEGVMTRNEFVASVRAYCDRHALPVESGTAVDGVEPDGRAASRSARRRASSGRATSSPPPATSTSRSARRSPPGCPRPSPRSTARTTAAPATCARARCSWSAAATPGARSPRIWRSPAGEVYLATGRNGRVPRRYRGHDIILWLMENGRYDQPRSAQAGRPLLGATHTLSLGSLSGLGITLLGRITGVTAGGALEIADDLAANAAHADKVSADIRREIDDYIDRQGLDAEPATLDPAEAMPARFAAPPIRELDLAARGITTVIWCVGFSGDYRWLRVPGATDAAGQPAQSRCLSVPGVYFAGINSLEALKSGTVMVAADKSRRIADHIMARV